MKNKELYDKTISILVQAYLNDTLEHSNCAACAVGNIVAVNMGVKLFKQRYFAMPIGSRGTPADTGLWFNAISDGFVNKNMLSPDILLQVKSTGYTPEELAKIELAFESADAPNGISNCFEPVWMYNGLMAVVEVLGQIHEVDKGVLSETKLMFIK